VIRVGDDWAEDHHDVELVDQDGRRLSRARLPEGLQGLAKLHELIAAQMPASWAELEALSGLTPADIAADLARCLLVDLPWEEPDLLADAAARAAAIRELGIRDPIRRDRLNRVLDNPSAGWHTSQADQPTATVQPEPTGASHSAKAGDLKVENLSE
jgi:hypothetical protein